MHGPAKFHGAAEKRQVDVCISVVPVIGSKVSVQKVGEFRLGLFASSKYVLQKGTPTSLSELISHEFVGNIDDLAASQLSQWLHQILVPEKVVSARKDRRLVWFMRDVVVVQPLFISVHEDVEYLSKVRALLNFLNELFRADKALFNDFE